jgi:hypothetical protein
MTYHINLQHRRGVKVLRTDNTSDAIRQIVTNSLITVNGSTMAYTPLEGSSYVIYEFVSQLQYDQTFNNALFRLRMGDTSSSLSAIASDDTGYKMKFGTGTSYSDIIGPLATNNVWYNQQVNLRFAISTSGWTSEKFVGLKIQCSPYESGYHRSRINAYSFDPFVIMYCI